MTRPFNHLEHGDIDPATGLVVDATLPYRLYAADLNFAGPLGIPFLGLP